MLAPNDENIELNMDIDPTDIRKSSCILNFKTTKNSSIQDNESIIIKYQHHKYSMSWILFIALSRGFQESLDNRIVMKITEFENA